MFFNYYSADSFETIIHELEQLKHQINTLQKQNDLLKSEEKYKILVEENQRLKQKLKRSEVQNTYYTITREERLAAEQWFDEHYKSNKNPDCSIDYSHVLSYSIVSTPLGNIKNACCSCGEKHELYKDI